VQFVRGRDRAEVGFVNQCIGNGDLDDVRAAGSLVDFLVDVLLIQVAHGGYDGLRRWRLTAVLVKLGQVMKFPL
jgi:hypothetical protein